MRPLTCALCGQAHPPGHLRPAWVGSEHLAQAEDLGVEVLPARRPQTPLPQGLAETLEVGGQVFEPRRLPLLVARAADGAQRGAALALLDEDLLVLVAEGELEEPFATPLLRAAEEVARRLERRHLVAVAAEVDFVNVAALVRLGFRPTRWQPLARPRPTRSGLLAHGELWLARPAGEGPVR